MHFLVYNVDIIHLVYNVDILSIKIILNYRLQFFILI